MIFYHDTYSTVKHWKLLCLRVQFYKIRLERKITWTIVFFLKSGPFPASFSFIFVFSIQLIINKCSIKFCRWLESNRGPLVLKATTLPTAPQPLTWTIVSITSCCEDSQPEVQNNLTFEDIFSSITYLRKSYLKSEQLTWIVNASCLLKASKTEPRQARLFHKLEMFRLFLETSFFENLTREH